MIHSLISVSGISETLETLSHDKLLSGDKFLEVFQTASMLSSDDLIGVVSVQFSNTGCVNFKRPRQHALLTPKIGLNLPSIMWPYCYK